MPPLLRPRLICHYCGQRSKSRVKDNRKFKFKCETCEAINFLDENGEVADVPPTETASPRQFAHPVTNTDAQSLEPSVFCSTCTKNQQLLTEALSNYLPPLDDPSYSKYEASLPEYKRNLEDRYPQVCAACEPRVRERIRQAGYHAKSDHLRRMMDRSRARKFANNRGWRSLVIRAGGLGYCASVIGQLLWHAMSALSSDAVVHSGAASYAMCIDQCLRHHRASPRCAQTFAPITGLALLISLSCIWWNPQWRHKLDGREGRLTGLSRYYELQAGTLLLRFGSWIWLREPHTSGLSFLQQRAVHSILLALELLLAAYSLFAAVKIDTTPLVSWQEAPAPLLSGRQYVPPQQPTTNSSAVPPSQPGHSVAQSFPVNNLALATQLSYDTWRPITPPAENADAMEWEPTSKPLFKPRPVRSKLVPEPSPFHGTLPALPNNRLLQPMSQSLPEPRQAIGVPPGFFDKAPCTESPAQSNSPVGPVLAEPKFFARSDLEADTGLEGMFTSVFSLDTDPVEVREPARPQSFRQNQYDTFTTTSVVRKPGQSPSQVIHCITASTSAVSFLMWILLTYSGADWSSIKFVISSLNALIPLVGVFLSLPELITHRRFGGVQWPIAESCALALLGTGDFGTRILGAEKRDLVIAGVLSMLWWQELYLCFPNPRRSSYAPPVDTDVNGIRAPQVSERAEKSPASFPQTVAQPEQRVHSYGSSSWQTTPSFGGISSFSRPRTNSIDSTATDVSTASTLTTSGWKTPKGPERRRSQSPGFSLGALALDDARSAGTSQRSNRRRARF